MNGPEVSDDELRGVTHDIAALIPAAIARRVRAVPLGFTYDDPPRLRVAMRDPEDPAAVAEVRGVTGHPVIPVRAWNVQMSLALDRLYPRVDIAPPRRVPEATRPPETLPAPKPAEDWRKRKIEAAEDGLLHDGDSALGRIAVYGLIAGCVIVALMFARVWLRERRQPGNFNGSTGEYVEGRTSFAAVGLSIDFGKGYWRHRDTEESTVLFVKPGPGEAYGYLRFWRRVGEAPEDTDALIEALSADKYGGDVESTTNGCEVSDLHEAPAIECHWPGWHYYAWVVDGDMIGVRYDEKYLCTVCMDELPDIVSSVRPL